MSTVTTSFQYYCTVIAFLSITTAILYGTGTEFESSGGSTVRMGEAGSDCLLASLTALRKSIEMTTY
jgi:hypothetical protein